MDLLALFSFERKTTFAFCVLNILQSILDVTFIKCYLDASCADLKCVVRGRTTMLPINLRKEDGKIPLSD